MFTAVRTQSTIKPEKFESLNNNVWYYNYDIKSEEVQFAEVGSEEAVTKTVYSYILVRINGKPDYNKCALAIIRAYIDPNLEFDLVNSFNAYLLGISDTVEEDYLDYLQLIKEIKANVGKDFNLQIVVKVPSTPRSIDVVKLMLMTINTISLDDLQSLEVKSLYPIWESFIGLTITKDTKILYNGKLFKVVQEHLVQEQYPPSINTASLYTEIVETHAGTLEDPIPYPADGNIIIYNGKYYTDNGVLYKCIRDSEIPLYTSLANVVGNYSLIVD